MAQRMLACTGCHGPQGRAASDGYYPRIAGKPAGYLFNQLVGFRDGQRRYELMANLLAPLTDEYLREIAAHFSQLELPYPPPPATADVDALTRGEMLVTPPISSGLLGGVLRRELIEEGRCEECVLMPEDLVGNVLLGNSLRGLIPAQAVQTSALARGA